MIIIGYQGIGKSSIAGRNYVIDLESGNFWFAGKRRKEWYVYYCNIAEHLSEQGYIVFVSSHKVVREYLHNYSKQSLYIVFPAVELKEEWVKRLQDRFNRTKLEKDLKAWKNAEERYKINITDLKKSGIQFYEITDMDYRLQDIVDYLVGFDFEWRIKNNMKISVDRVENV